MTEKNLFEMVGTSKPAKSVFGLLNEDYDEDEEDIPAASGPGSAWAEGDGRFWVAPSSHRRLPVGVYRMEMHPHVGASFVRQRNATDEIVRLPDSESDAIVEEIRQFKSLRPRFREYGFLFKRGYLLWGPPGSGKTCTLQQIIQLLMHEHDAITVLVEHPAVASNALQALRRVEPERQIVALLEDLDVLCHKYNENGYLALTDGESQVDNIVFVATTNHPENLDARFVDRPSRFDSVRYIGMPTSAARAHYLRTKMPMLPEEYIGQYVAVSEGYSIAHLRELVILTRCFEYPFEASIQRLNRQRFNHPDSTKPPDAATKGPAVPAQQAHPLNGSGA